MASSTVEKAYAEGLYRAAKKAGAAPAVAGELASLAAAFSEKRLKAFLATPSIPAAAKREALKKALSGKVSPLTLNFLRLLVDKRRQSALAGIYREFQKLLDADQGLVRGELVQAAGDETLAGRAETALSAHLGKSVRLERKVDPHLIGGAVIRIGDLLLDGSFRSKLKALRGRMLAAGA